MEAEGARPGAGAVCSTGSLTELDEAEALALVRYLGGGGAERLEDSGELRGGQLGRQVADEEAAPVALDKNLVR